MNEKPSDSTSDFNEHGELVDRLRAGDRNALAESFDQHRPKLWRMVRFRMDPRLAARVDPDDVLQEAYLNAASRIQHYLNDPSRSLFVWFRLIVGQTLIDVHRRHLKAEMRDAHRDILLGDMRQPQAISVSLAPIAVTQTPPASIATIVVFMTPPPLAASPALATPATIA